MTYDEAVQIFAALVGAYLMDDQEQDGKWWYIVESLTGDTGELTVLANLYSGEHIGVGVYRFELTV